MPVILIITSFCQFVHLIILVRRVLPRETKLTEDLHTFTRQCMDLLSLKHDLILFWLTWNYLNHIPNSLHVNSCLIDVKLMTLAFAWPPVVPTIPGGLEPFSCTVLLLWFDAGHYNHSKNSSSTSVLCKHDPVYLSFLQPGHPLNQNFIPCMRYYLPNAQFALLKNWLWTHAQITRSNIFQLVLIITTCMQVYMSANAINGCRTSAQPCIIK